MTSTPPHLCRNCGAAISDHDIHPAAKLCPACRLEARRRNSAANRTPPPRKPRVCKHCGGEITDLEAHPRASTCPACRWASTRLRRVVPIVRAYVDQQGWPTWLKATKVMDEHPEVMAQITTHSRTYAMTLFTGAARELIGPQGQRYISWAGRRGQTLLVAYPDDVQREAVTCE